MGFGMSDSLMLTLTQGPLVTWAIPMPQIECITYDAQPGTRDDARLSVFLLSDPVNAQKFPCERGGENWDAWQAWLTHL